MLPLCLLRDIAKLEACAFLSIVSVSVVTVAIIAKLAMRDHPPTDALQFAGGPQLHRRGAASGMDDSASLSAASLQRHREAAEAAQIRQAIADQHTTLDEAPTSTSQEEAMLARAMEESRQSASAAAPDAFAPVAPPAADPFAAPPAPIAPGASRKRENVCVTIATTAISGHAVVGCGLARTGFGLKSPHFPSSAKVHRAPALVHAASRDL